jgi:peptide-methionine (S)-S-oxide reductase
MQRVAFAGGCFWCVEAVFKRLRGVVSVESGYAGGFTENPSYYDVVEGNTGHVESVELVFDEEFISFDVLLSVFFAFHDPSTLDRQGNDVGTQYNSVIFYTREEQKIEAEKFIQKLEEDKVFINKILTKIKPLEKFFPAEDYHQNYYDINSNQIYCQLTIDPKIAKLREKFSYLLKEETE